MFHRFYIRFGILCGLLFIGNLGCSSKTGPAMVSGKVKYGNHQFKSWYIHFDPKNPAGVGLSAKLERDGSFRLRTRLDPNEAYVVYFAPPDEYVNKDPDKGTPPEPPIPEKYASLKTTDLVIDVTPGTNAVEFELKP